MPTLTQVPMIDDPALVGPLEDLEEHTVGLLKLVVHRARDVPKMDVGGKADPVMVMYTGPTHKVETSVKKNSLEPEWEETYYLTVEEPKDQNVRVEMYDVDMVGLGGGGSRSVQEYGLVAPRSCALLIFVY